MSFIKEFSVKFKIQVTKKVKKQIDDKEKLLQLYPVLICHICRIYSMDSLEIRLTQIFTHFTKVDMLISKKI